MMRARQLDGLRQTEGWDAYRASLAEIEQQFIQTLVTCEAAKHDYLTGYIAGLRNAAALPDLMMRKVRELQETR